jgi:hypothetical protein
MLETSVLMDIKLYAKLDAIDITILDQTKDNAKIAKTKWVPHWK